MPVAIRFWARCIELVCDILVGVSVASVNQNLVQSVLQVFGILLIADNTFDKVEAWFQINVCGNVSVRVRGRFNMVDEVAVVIDTLPRNA